MKQLVNILKQSSGKYFWHIDINGDVHNLKEFDKLSVKQQTNILNELHWGFVVSIMFFFALGQILDKVPRGHR
jgi:hypothetical protein